ncbi:MAG: FAD-dependent oxidoreductase, partial [Solirubrobacteraceae bacterium]|nr:FAD-dependent oxidoreductase [Solirubrobacteraceae bacterium]
MTHDAIAKFLGRSRIATLRDGLGRSRRGADHAEPWFRVVIVGGGVAALEAMFALQALAGGQVAVQLIAPEDAFTYRPLEVREPFAGSAAPRYSLADAASAAGAELICGQVDSVRADLRRVALDDGTTHPYDALILCLGATPVWPLEHARDIRPGALDETLHGFVQDVE